MDINGNTALCCLLGKPVSHSLSPAMHNAAFLHLKINARYLCFEIQDKNGLRDAVKGIKAMRFLGANITMPYKEAVIPLLDEVTDLAKRIGAVNTVFRRNNRLIGTNTDGEGFYRDLRDRCRFSAKNKVCAVFGSGGAAKAVAFALADANAKRLIVCDRDRKQSARLCARLRRHMLGNSSLVAIDYGMLTSHTKEIELVVNATPVGMGDNDKAVVDLSLFPKRPVVYDLIYKKGQTALIKQAKELSLVCADGLGMLLHQGAIAFKHWTQEDPPIAVMEKALRSALKKGE